MATNNSASLANQFKAPSLPSVEEAFSGFKSTKPTNPTIPNIVVPKQTTTRTTGVGTTSVDVDIATRAQDKETISSLASQSSIEARVAQGEGLFNFATPTKEPTLENFDIDALGNIKLSVYESKKRIDDFNNPKSSVATAFKNNLGEKRYEFTKLVEDVKKKATSRAALEKSQGTYNQTVDDMAEAIGEEGITGIISTAPTKALDYIFGQTQYKTNKYAKEYNLSTGEETRSPIAEGIASFGVNAPFYMAMGGLSGGAALGRVAGFGLNVVKGEKGVAIAKLASNLESMSMKYPTLYAASIDNALTTSLEYTGRASAGMDTSGAANDIIFGAALPTAFKGVGKAFTAFRDLKPKDVDKLEKALFEEVQASVDKDPRKAFNTMVAKGETYFEDGTTLTSRIEEANKIAEGEKQRIAPLTAEEVISEFAGKSITVTKAGGRMIAEAINKLNAGIKGIDEMGNGFGDVGADGKAMMAKQTLVNNIQELGVANEESVAKAIEDAKVSNGVEIEVKKSELSEEEQFEELLSNPDNNIENLLDAKNANDVKAAVEGAKNTKKATKEGLDGLRFATDTGELKLDELQAMADEQGVKINPDKLYKKQSVLETKAPELDKDYINKIIDEVELKRTGYSGIKSTVINSFKSGINAAVEKAKTLIGQTTGDNYKPKYLRGEGVGRGKVDVNKLTLSELDEFNAARGELDIKGSKAKAAADKAIKAMAVAIRKEGNELALRLKNAVKATEKVKIQKLIDANKAKIVELKKKATYKDKIKTNFVKYVKNSIDSAGSQYTRSYFRRASTAKEIESAQVAALRGQTPRAIRTEAGSVTETVLSKAKINEIKNKYKALIHPTTTVNRAMELMKRMDEELHKLSYDKMEKDADDLITKVMKAATNKKTKATVDIQAVMKMADTYIKIRKANGDLDKMRDLIVDLENFHREGKDAFKANIATKKIEVKGTIQEGKNVLDKLGLNMFGIRGFNTPTGGKKKDSIGVDLVNWLGADTISADLNIRRMFGPAKQLVETFIGTFQRAQGRYNNIRREVVDIHGVNALREANKLLKTNEGDASYKLTLWMRRDTEYGHEGNKMSNMTLRRTKDNKWEVLFISDPKAHRDVKQAEYDKGNYIYFGDKGNDDLKESILESIYRPFDDAMSIKINTKTGKPFPPTKLKNEIDWIKAHFSRTGDDIIDIGKNNFNKIDFHKQEHYFPSAKRGKDGDDSSIDAEGKYDGNTQESIQNGFLNKKVKPSEMDMQDMEMGFVENLAYHTDTAVWWKENIEGLLVADKTRRQLRKGRKGLEEDVEFEIDEKMLFDTSRFDKNNDIGVSSNLDSPMITREADTYLRSHLAKVATRGRSMSPFSNEHRFLTRLLNHANEVILAVPTVAAKQAMGYPVIALHAGTKNMVNGLKNSTFNRENLAFAYKASGNLMERQETRLSKEGRGFAHYVTQSDEQLTKYFGVAGQLYKNTMQGLIGNTTKFVDGAVSGTAWMAGMSKYLDEQGIVKSGSKYNLEKIAMQLGDEKWEEAVAYADEMMGRIMGSNALVDKAIGANGVLAKTTMLFMRTGLHQMVSAFDTLNDIATDAKFKGDDKTRQMLLRVAQGGKIALASVAVAIMNEAINEGRIGIKRMTGVKTEEDQFAIREVWSGKAIKDPTIEEIALDIANRWVKSVTVNPKTAPDLLTGYSAMIGGIKDAISAPTLARQREELIYAVGKGFIPSEYGELIRWGITQGGIGLTPVDAKTYDAAVNTIKTNNPNAESQPNFEEQVSTQIKINEEQKALSDAKKPDKEAEKKFIEEGVKKYGKDITREELYNLYKSIPGMKPVKTESDKLSLRAKIQIAAAKSEGEVYSLLQGKSNEVIFNVAIKDMIDNGDLEGAKQKIIEFRRKGVIKTDSGLNNMKKIFKEYRISIGASF